MLPFKYVAFSQVHLHFDLYVWRTLVAEGMAIVV